MRVGFGYDVHAFVDGRPLVIGGVQVPHSRGLLGHSDADVLLHALCDAILGAAALGDLGRHFPDTDPQFKGASSLELLVKTMELLRSEGFTLVNIDTTVVAQRPKLATYVPAMIECISQVCGLSLSSVSVKATTTEHLGFAGREEGIAAYAIVMIMDMLKNSE